MSSLENSYDLLQAVIKHSKIEDTDWDQVALELSIVDGARLSKKGAQSRWQRWGTEHVKKGASRPPSKSDKKIAPRKPKLKTVGRKNGSDEEDDDNGPLPKGSWPKGKKGRGPAKKGVAKKEESADDDGDASNDEASIEGDGDDHQVRSDDEQDDEA